MKISEPTTLNKKSRILMNMKNSCRDNVSFWIIQLPWVLKDDVNSVLPLMFSIKGTIKCYKKATKADYYKYIRMYKNILTFTCDFNAILKTNHFSRATK
jgi:hypothetical protein